MTTFTCVDLSYNVEPSAETHLRSSCATVDDSPPTLVGPLMQFDTAVGPVGEMLYKSLINDNVRYLRVAVALSSDRLFVYTVDSLHALHQDKWVVRLWLATTTDASSGTRHNFDEII